MAIGVNPSISSADLANQASGTITISKPAGTAATDVLAVAFALDDVNSGSPTISAPTGWTAITAGFRQASGVNSLTLYGFWALGNVANLGFTFTRGGASNADIGWLCIDYTGVDNTTPIDANDGAANGTAGASSVTSNAVTVVTDQAWHVILSCDFLGKVAFTATGFTEQHNGAVNAAIVQLYNQSPKAIGSTGTVVVNNSDATSSGEVMAAMPFALRPAAGSGGFGDFGVINRPVAQGWI